MTELEAQVAGLRDREAIRGLPIAYCHYVWKADAEALAGLFTKRGRLEVPDGFAPNGEVVGAEALLAFYRLGVAGLVAGIDPRPFVHNHHLELLGEDLARGYVYAEIRNGHQAFRVTQMVVYEDTYAREDGVWKFAERKLELTQVPA